MERYPWDLDLAEDRGWDRDKHRAALESGDEDAISLTHPTNWLDEDEVEYPPCNQSPNDGCADSDSPSLGRCVACGFIFHDIPTYADDPHGELCCGTAVCSARGNDICVTHDT